MRRYLACILEGHNKTCFTSSLGRENGVVWQVLLAVFATGLLLGCNSGSQPAASRDVQAPEASSPAADTSTTATESSTAEDSSAEETSGQLVLEQVTLDPPESWKRVPNESGFILAEYSLPAPEGAEGDGRLTISVAGGSIDANIDRWRGQFGGKPEQESKKEFEVVGLPVTVVDFTGEFNDQRGPFAPPGAKHAGYRMLAAIISVDGQLHFIKATGPQETIAAHADEFDAFVRSVRKR